MERREEEGLVQRLGMYNTLCRLVGVGAIMCQQCSYIPCF